jgi:type III secretion translocon protein HrpF
MNPIQNRSQPKTLPPSQEAEVSQADAGQASEAEVTPEEADPATVSESETPSAETQQIQEDQMQSDRAAADAAMSQKDNDNQALHVLQMHQDKLPKKMNDNDIDKMISDPNTQPDLKDALQYLKDNPDFKKKLDTAGKGGDPDGTISHKDLNAAAEDPSYAAFCSNKSQSYANNYVPSDAKTAEDAKPRKMDASAAYREIYKYADSLPDGISEEEVKKIASGKSHGKTPPQVMAAAQFLADNPDALAKVVGPKGHLDNNQMEDALVQQITLNASEKEALETIKNKKNEFFGDKKLNREELEKIAQDPSKSPDIQKAAKQLLESPVLFGMLDNASTGHGGNATKKANDGVISSKDADAKLNSLTSENTAAEKKPVASSAPQTAEDAQNLQEMTNGVNDQPDIKKSSGGGLADFARSLLKVWSKVLDIAKTIVDAVTSVLPPPFKAMGIAVSAGIAAQNNLVVKPAVAMMEGKSAKEAYTEGAKGLAMDAAGTAASAVIPGGSAIAAGASKEAIKAGAKEAAKDAAKEAITNEASQQAQNFVVKKVQA